MTCRTPGGAAPGAPHHARGFTLPEILIVIVMISVLALLALPRFANANARRHMESARLRVTAALATARQAAVQKGAPVTFSLVSNRVRVTESGIDLISPVPLDTLYKVTASLGVSTGGVVVFSGRGMATLSGPTKIMFTRSGIPKDSVMISKFGMVQR